MMNSLLLYRAYMHVYCKTTRTRRTSLQINTLHSHRCLYITCNLKEDDCVWRRMSLELWRRRRRRRHQLLLMGTIPSTTNDRWLDPDGLYQMLRRIHFCASSKYTAGRHAPLSWDKAPPTDRLPSAAAAGATIASRTHGRPMILCDTTTSV